MKSSRHTAEQVAFAMRQVESGTSVLEICWKMGIAEQTFYSWKKKFETMGEAGFRHGMTPAHLKENKRLVKENQVLKKLLAEKELEGHLKSEALKKKYALAIKNK
ncbi:hypothetical protein LCGC14_2334720 [marine sediment metagenome]|uniref:Transposase n=1 Tax=marine sediment metagenome TaxID=412755 RepID=A0A0F9D192_9ZZZZ